MILDVFLATWIWYIVLMIIVVWRGRQIPEGGFPVVFLGCVVLGVITVILNTGLEY